MNIARKLVFTVLVGHACVLASSSARSTSLFARLRALHKRRELDIPFGIGSGSGSSSGSGIGCDEYLDGFTLTGTDGAGSGSGEAAPRCKDNGEIRESSGSIHWKNPTRCVFCDEWNIGEPGQETLITFPVWLAEEGDPYDRVTICDDERCVDQHHNPEYFPSYNDKYESNFEEFEGLPHPSELPEDFTLPPEIPLIMTGPIYIHINARDDVSPVNQAEIAWEPYTSLKPRRWHKFRADDFLANDGSDGREYDLEIRSQTLATARSVRCDNALLEGCFTAHFTGRAVIPALSTVEYGEDGWSACMWVKMTEEPYTFVQWGGSWLTTFWYLGYVTAHGGYFFPTAALGSWDQSSQFHVDASPAEVLGRWRHICWVVDFRAAENTHTLFLDGKPAEAPHRFNTEIAPSAEQFESAGLQSIELGSAAWKTLQFADVRLYDAPLPVGEVCRISGTCASPAPRPTAGSGSGPGIGIPTQIPA